MKKNYQAIYSKDWMAFHPYQASAPTDFYYTQLANRVYAIISESAQTDFSDRLSDNECQVQLSCILTCYFEDVIAQTGMFRAFTRTYSSRFGKPLPFYSVGEEYLPEEINTEDVRFLIWHFLVQMCDGDIPSSPADAGIARLAGKVMELFDAAYETAPENKKLKEYFLVPDNTDLYVLQSKFFWLGTESYLFFSDGIGLQSAIENALQQVKSEDGRMDIPAFVNIMCNDFAYNKVTEFLGLSSAQWLASMLGETHPLYQRLWNLTHKYSGYFLYEGEAETGSNFLHIVSGTRILITAQSMKGFPKELKTDTAITHMRVVKWDDLWWLVGQVNGYKKNEEMMKEVNSREEEKQLFEDLPATPLPENEQMEIFEQEIKKLPENNLSEEQRPLAASWDTVCRTELSRGFIRRMYEEGKLPDFRFPGTDGKQLVDENFDFLMDYFKAD